MTVIRSKYPLLPVRGCCYCSCYNCPSWWKLKGQGERKEKRKYEGNSQLIQLLTESKHIKEQTAEATLIGQDKSQVRPMKDGQWCNEAVKLWPMKRPIIHLKMQSSISLLMYFSSLLTSVKLTNMCLYQLSASASFQGSNIYSTACLSLSLSLPRCMPLWPGFLLSLFSQEERAIFLSHSTHSPIGYTLICNKSNWKVTWVTQEDRERKKNQPKLNGLRSGISKDAFLWKISLLLIYLLVHRVTGFLTAKM